MNMTGKRMTKMKEKLPFLFERLIPEHEKIREVQMLLESELKYIQATYINHLGMHCTNEPMKKGVMCYG